MRDADLKGVVVEPGNQGTSTAFVLLLENLQQTATANCDNNFSSDYYSSKKLFLA